MASGRKSAAKKKAAAKTPANKSAVKRRTSVKRNSKARQRALDAALQPAASAGSTIRLPAAKLTPAKKNAEKKSLGQRIRGFVEKRLG